MDLRKFGTGRGLDTADLCGGARALTRSNRSLRPALKFLESLTGEGFQADSLMHSCERSVSPDPQPSRKALAPRWSRRDFT